jgi:alginate O-acetyltransferase complex protein AlgJ
MAERRPDSRPLYLATDTHWTPPTMERVAGMIADEVRRVAKVADVPPPAYGVASVSVTNTGDIAAMLKLPAGNAMVSPEAVTVRQVRDGATGLWRPDEGADVLLLGDSFANIYSLEPMGWGEAGGLAEHLSLALARPIDALRRNDAGSWATRSMLANELARGHDRLAGKKVVVWEFAARELSAGDWKLIELKQGTARPAGFYTPPLGASVSVRGIVRAIAAAPRPGSVPYKDHIVALHIADIEGGGAAPAGSQALVYMWSMRDNVWTPAARWLPGQEITLRLRPWADVESRWGAVNRAELADEALVLEAPCWADE